MKTKKTKTDSAFGEQQEAVSQSWTALMMNKSIFLYSALFDLLFLFIAGTVNGVIVKKLTGIMYIIGGLLSKASLDLSGSPSLVELLTHGHAWRYVIQLIILFLIWLAGLYFLYCLFQGLSWRLSYAAWGKQKPLVSFMKRFFRVNIPWYLLFVLLNALLFVIAYISTSLAKKTGVSMHWLWYVPYLLLLYAMLVSYGRIEETSIRASLQEAWRRKNKLFVSFLVILLFFTITHLVLIGAGYIGRTALILAGFLVFIPAFTAARVYWLYWFEK